MTEAFALGLGYLSSLPLDHAVQQDCLQHLEFVALKYQTGTRLFETDLARMQCLLTTHFLLGDYGCEWCFFSVEDGKLGGLMLS